MAPGRGGIAAVVRATGISRQVIGNGIKERHEGTDISEGRIRQPEGGRTRAVSNDAYVQEDQERLVEPVTLSDPDSPQRWTCKRVRTLAAELVRLAPGPFHGEWNSIILPRLPVYDTVLS
jgi:hypothetical protein